MVLEILIALLIILLLLILFVSFHVMLVLDKRGGEFQHKIRIKWLFLSYSVDPLKLAGKGRSGKKEKTSRATELPTDKPKKEKTEPQPVEAERQKKDESSVSADQKNEDKESERWSVSNIIKMIRLLIVPVVRLAEGILGAIDIHKLNLDLKFGFDDPADTGMVVGYLYALRGYLEYQYERVRLYAEPNFIEMMLDFHIIGDIKFRIASLLPAIMRFIFNRNVLRLSWALIRKKDIPDPA